MSTKELHEAERRGEEEGHDAESRSEETPERGDPLGPRRAPPRGQSSEGPVAAPRDEGEEGARVVDVSPGERGVSGCGERNESTGEERRPDEGRREPEPAATPADRDVRRQRKDRQSGGGERDHHVVRGGDPTDGGERERGRARLPRAEVEREEEERSEEEVVQREDLRVERTDEERTLQPERAPGSDRGDPAPRDRERREDDRSHRAGMEDGAREVDAPGGRVEREPGEGVRQRREERIPRGVRNPPERCGGDELGGVARERERRAEASRVEDEE